MFRQLADAEAIVCAPMDMTAREIARFASAQRCEEWEVSGEIQFASGALNPSPCPADPSKVHYLLVERS